MCNLRIKCHPDDSMTSRSVHKQHKRLLRHRIFRDIQFGLNVFRFCQNIYPYHKSLPNPPQFLNRMLTLLTPLRSTFHHTVLCVVLLNIIIHTQTVVVLKQDVDTVDVVYSTKIHLPPHCLVCSINKYHYTYLDRRSS